MYNHQEILRKHTALSISRKDVSTSLVLFPVRVETRFVEGHVVEDVSEPNRVLYVFKDIWSYLQCLDIPDSRSAVVKRLLEHVESLDTVYREDKTRLRHIVTEIRKNVYAPGNEASFWGRIQDHIERLATLDIVSDNEATDFLRRLDKVDRTIRQLRYKPRYMGTRRHAQGSKYSQSVVFKNAVKQIRECLPVLEQLLPLDPAKSIVNRFSVITPKQFQKFLRVTRFFSIPGSEIRANFTGIGSTDGKRPRDPQLREYLWASFYYRVQSYDQYRDRYLGFLDVHGQWWKGRIQSITDKMRSKVGEYHHYTHFAERMIMWKLRLVTRSRRSVATESRVLAWRKLAGNTIFHFHEEREWLVSVLAEYNAYQKTVNPAYVISTSQLNRHNRYIRPRKLSYPVQTKKSLLVRIYPDEVAVTQLIRPLTQEELGHARDFWLRYFAADKDDARKMAAWKSLCSLYDAPRAALIARYALRDSGNLNELKRAALRHAAEIERGLSDDLQKELHALFPQVNTSEPAENDLFPVPVTEMMPDRFVVQAKLNNGVKGSKTLVRYGHLIPKSVQIGFDFSGKDGVDVKDGRMRLEGNLRWMTDYDAAERMGMAVTIPLDEFYYDHYACGEKKRAKERNQRLSPKKRVFHFDSVYVMGMKELNPDNATDSAECSELLAQVFNAHLYSEGGLDVLKIGTPTNILSDDDMALKGTGHAAMSSDYDTGKEALVESFFSNNIKPFMEESGRRMGDAWILAKLFGMDVYSPRENPLLNVAGRNNDDLNLAARVREIFLESLLETQPMIKELSDCNRLKSFFRDHVSPIGVFPSFRIGSQPYGVVPVCDFKELRYKPGDPLNKVKELLLALADLWNAMATNYVVSEENMNRNDKMSTEERYLKAVSATPFSTSFYSRPAVQERDVLPPDFFRGLKDGVDPVAPIYEIFHAMAPSMSRDDFLSKYFPFYRSIPVRGMDHAWKLKSLYWGPQVKAVKASFPNASDQEIRDLFTATFDLFNHRLDAWFTGLLHQRWNAYCLGSRPKIAIGAYGWVFNLKEDPHEPVSDEFVLAPSINQAVTAAVLRSGFNRAAEGDKKDYSLSVNLSSVRVRQALRIIQGIQNGLSLGTILGSDLERLLHDDKNRSGIEMDYFIYFLRAAYPLNDTTTTYGPGDKDHSIDVLNGVALLEDLRSRVKDVAGAQKLQLTQLYAQYGSHFQGWLTEIFHQDSFQDVVNLFGGPNTFGVKIPRLFFLMQEMEDSYDALSDVVTAESVYKLTEGNQVAVEALMNSMNTGRNIPMPDVTEIPVRSAHIEQRVFAALDTQPEEPDCNSFYRMAEPALDQWMGDMLGFSYIWSGNPDAQRRLGEKGLGLSPSELVYLSGDWDKFEHFLQLLDRCHPGNDLPGEPILLEEAKMAVDSMRELLSHARPLRQDDLITSAIPADPALEKGSVCGFRYAKVSQKVHELTQQLEKQASRLSSDLQQAPGMPMSEGQLRKTIDLLLQCFRLGYMDALSGIDLDLFVREDLRYDHPTEFADILSRQRQLPARLSQLAKTVYERLMKAEEISKTSIPDAMKELLGSWFVPVPPFQLDGETVDVQALVEQAETPDFFRNAGRMVLEDNLVGLADVRRPMAALHQVRLAGKFNGIPAVRDLKPMQLGYKAKSEDDKHYWMGAEFPYEYLVQDASVYTVFNPSQLIVRKGDSLRDVAGVVFDFWVEKIPYAKQTAGLVFGYDQPDAEPPQAVLFGVSPVGGNHRWTERRMLRTIHSAMYQVKSRAVEPEHLYANPATSGLAPAISIEIKPENTAF